MTALLLISGGAIALLTIFLFASARRRVRAGPDNGWKNEAYMAREATGSWSENECAIGREDQAPPSIFPGIP